VQSRIRLGDTMKRKQPVASELLQFRLPGSEKIHSARVVIYAPRFEKSGSWVCQFDFPKFATGNRGYGYGSGPVTALAAAGANLRFFLDRVVDISTVVDKKPASASRKAKKSARSR